MRLKAGQVAVVTGAASGIGRGLAEEFLRRGLAVVAADVEDRALGQAVDEMTAAGGPVVGQVTDVRDPDALQRLASRTLGELGHVDVLCNNAGVITPRLPVWEQPAEDWRWTLDVNLLGVVNGIRAFVPHLVAQGSGHVVNTSSIAGLAPVPGGGNAAYAASKHAVVGLSEVLVEELATVGADVGVTVLCPGPVPTRIRDAERNRPAELVGSAGGGSLPPPDFQLTLEPVDAATVAAQVCAAIETGRRYVLPGPGTPEMARRRIEGVLADLG
jgi:NAD(P)-dependent dehydrogenase (short-subunit alcohol dehydrogenase family)